VDISERKQVISTYGRRNGRPLKDHSKELFESVLPLIQIDLPEYGVIVEPWVFFDKNQPTIMEVGFGGGEHLYALAKLHPEINFIGCEPYIPGISSLLHHVESENLSNIKIYTGNALELLSRLTDHSLSKLFLMFPDPWPKKRHNKRRFIQHPILEVVAQKLIPGGTLHGATDHADYQVWIEKHLEESTLFTRQFWSLTKTEDWPDTRYEAKAKVEGRPSIYYIYKSVEKLPED
jgi:tRNA (guanine-N7-)-methyltransferase